jgi:hypothetical protein
MLGSCEYGNKRSFCINRGEFLYWMSDQFASEELSSVELVIKDIPCITYNEV